jgi:hypothetical protein
MLRRGVTGIDDDDDDDDGIPPVPSRAFMACCGTALALALLHIVQFVVG